LTYGVAFGAPNSRAKFVSFSVKSGVGAPPSGAAAVAAARAAGDGRVLATALRHLAHVDWLESGSTPETRVAFEEAVAAARAADYAREVGYSLSWLSMVVLDLGDEATSLAVEAEGRRILREVGDRDALGVNLASSAENALARGDHAAARALFDEMLVIAREMGGGWNEIAAQVWLGDLARAEGDLAAARARYAAALGVGRARGARQFGETVTRALRSLAGLSVAAGDPRRAVRVFGAEAAARGDGPIWRAPGTPLGGERWEEDLRLARAALDQATFAACWSAGRAMTLEEAIADALSDASEDPSTPGGSADATGGQPA
jgi:hypothetical protein